MSNFLTRLKVSYLHGFGRWVLTWLASLLLLVPAAGAVDLLNSTTGNLQSGVAISSQGPIAQGPAFSVGASGYTINSIEFVPVSVGTQFSGSITLSLYQVNSSCQVTGSALASETINSVSYVNASSATVANKVTFSPSIPSAWAINAAGNYAVVFSLSPNTNTTGVAASSAAISTGASGLTLLSCEAYSFLGTWESDHARAPFWIKVTSSADPAAGNNPIPTISEWGTILLACLLVFGACVPLRRRA